MRGDSDMDDMPTTPGYGWTTGDTAAHAAIAAGEPPTEIGLSDGRTVTIVFDEIVDVAGLDDPAAGGKAGALQRMMQDLIRAGRKNDSVGLSNPTDQANRCFCAGNYRGGRRGP
jgi:hypothetical protein